MPGRRSGWPPDVAVGNLEAVFTLQDVPGRLIGMEKSSLVIELNGAQRHLVECVVGDEQALM